MRDPSLLFVFAHPDDEVSFSGATLRALQQNARVTFVCATNGQARIPNGQPSDFRKRQMQSAAKLLGIDRLIFLDWEDGELGLKYDLAALEEKIAGIIDEIQPNFLFTFPPDGITYHPDHIVMHHVTKNAFFKTLNKDHFRSLYYWCRLPQEFLQKSRKPVSQEILKKHGWDLTEADPTIALDVRNQVNRKPEALLCHEGQRLIDYLRGLGEEKRTSFLGYEHFYLAFSNDVSKSSFPLFSS